MRTLLLVDDEPQARQFVSNMFTAHEWHVVTCINGTDAAALASVRSFDLILADVVMEGIVGTALLEAIRSSALGARTPVVFMSNMPERRVRRIIEGQYGFVQKPFDYDDVIDAAEESALPAARAAELPQRRDVDRHYAR